MFISEVLDSKERWETQRKIIESVRDNRNTFVKAAHGLGKTFTAKDVALWFLYTHYPAKVITTAPSYVQVEKLLWSEINKAHKNAKVRLGGRCTLTALNIEPEWFALGISPKIDSTDDGDRMTGFHSENMLIIFDEAPACNPKLWAIKETLMTSDNVKFLGIGNPVVDSGDFFEGFRSENVNAINMSIFDSPNFVINGITHKDHVLEIAQKSKEERDIILKGFQTPLKFLTTVKWSVERILDWGAESPMTQARVFGEFPTKSQDTCISYTALEQCSFIMPQIRHPKVLGVDVARYGSDFTFFIGYENGKEDYKKGWNGQDTVKTANVIKHLIKQGYEVIVIDDTGIGGAVTDQITHFVYESNLSTKIIPVNFASASDDELYDGIVTQMWFNTKKLIEEKQISVTDTGNMFAELSSRRYKLTHTGQFRIESKDDYKKRTGNKSPDEADAFILCQWGVVRRETREAGIRVI